MNNINNDDDLEKKKQGFTEVLKLMEMCNAANNSKDKAGAMVVAKIFKNQYDAFISVGFTREESIQLLSCFASGISSAIGGK